MARGAAWSPALRTIRNAAGFLELYLTIDSFALALLNRWRTALGISLPICAAPARCTERLERHSRLHLPFEEITASAASLLSAIHCRPNHRL